MTPIYDLHCDLLAYLGEDTSRSPFDTKDLPCSLSYLQEGGVQVQVLPIFTETGQESVPFAEKQLLRYRELLKEKNIRFPLAVENASGLLGEEEPFSLFFQRLTAWHREFPITYLSLTWNEENRFGGGNASTAGIKEEGREVLSFLAEKKIAIDLSHTSDALARDILEEIDKKGLKIKVIASHSNFRAICDVPRNLPDEIALEIIRRDGLIGFNFFRTFIGKDFTDLLKHLAHGKKLGALDHLALGADFFSSANIPEEFSQELPFFFEELSDARCYPKVQELFSEILSRDEWEKIAYQNVSRSLEIYAPS